MSEIEYKTLRENVVYAIRNKLLNQELVPGERIIEHKLSEEFGVSRGPIREALRQLEQEGLIEYTRNVGCSVRKITIEDVYEIYLMRSNYEILAIRQYGGIFTAKDLSEMEQVLQKMHFLKEGEKDKLIIYDNMLHRILVAKAKLPRLLKSWEELNYGNMLAPVSIGPHKPNFTNRQFVNHRKLLNVFQNGSLEECCQAVYLHYMQPLKKMAVDCGLSLDDFRFEEICP